MIFIYNDSNSPSVHHYMQQIHVMNIESYDIEYKTTTKFIKQKIQIKIN